MDLITCLWFDGRAREAANFYTSIFPDSHLDDNWIAPTDTPGNKQGEEIVVNFQIFGRKFIGLNGGPQFPHSEAISFQIPCADASNKPAKPPRSPTTSLRRDFAIDAFINSTARSPASISTPASL